MVDPRLIREHQIESQQSELEQHLLSGGFLSVDKRYSIQIGSESKIIAIAYLFESTNGWSQEHFERTFRQKVKAIQDILQRLPKIMTLSQESGLEIRLNEDYGQGSFTWCLGHDARNIQWVHPKFTGAA